MTSERVRAHARAFNAAVRSKDFAAFVATFTDDAVMRFVGVPAGPFVGRAAIAEAYASRPPADTLAVDEVSTQADVDVVRFHWDGGGTGTFTVWWRDGQVADLTVVFG